MKIAISNLAWNTEEDEIIAKLLRKTGIKGIEIAPTKVWAAANQVSPAEVDRVRNFWKEYEVEIIGSQAILYGQPKLVVFGSREVRRATLSYIKSVIELTANLGGKTVVFGSPKNRCVGGLERQKIQATAQEFFLAIGEIAKMNQVRFCIEPNPVEYGADFITNTNEAIKLVRTINHPRVMINLDISTLVLNGEDFKKSIKNAGTHIGHVHLSEPRLKPLKPRVRMHQTIAGALKGSGYQGWISVEMLPPKNNGLKKLREILTFVKAVYG